ncbi:rhodanese-related sulfurtransferase [Corynebacterium uropygiale]|uniref:tRNA uridine(34) hydroxylase n=1 Tax=Corynebacterium uropygiale TaxID=1775911 RepID=A0A9X1QUE9_9CORY|nr:rhodanese-related sulfurtransferase [Corynebacterium uropygiale]MCF4007724.1 rhodanese-related sulfurtransferase [Corynebacterium uropygiale]
MAVPKIILFYVFTPLADPEAIRLWQRSLCEQNNLRGRIIVSRDGINATLGGELDDVKRYVRGLHAYAPFKGADIKWSEGRGDDFPRLSVKVRPELVTFGAPDELHVSAAGVEGGGQRLSPEGLHRLMAERGEDVVFFDGRNAKEAEVGKFRGAVVPETRTTRDFLPELESGKYDDLKDKTVVTYCTGGIRCEILTVLMKNRGFKDVYQLDGGIHRYTEKYRDRGFWEGDLYVFDQRETLEVKGGEELAEKPHTPAPAAAPAPER